MKRNFLKITSGLALVMLAFSHLVWADDAELLSLVKDMQKEMKGMKSTIESQDRKIAMLESRPTGGASITSAPQGESHIPPYMSDADFTDKLDNYMGGKDSSKWLKNLKFSGDMRLRYEAVSFAKGNPNHSGATNRFRFRLRYGFEKTFNPDMKVGFRLASGQTTDPTSTNQTLTGNFADKTHVIDRVYAIYTPTWAKVGPINKFEIGGGKFANPFTRGSSDIVWDDDVNPEGAYEMIDLNLIDGEDFGIKGFATAGQMILKEAAHAAASAHSELYAYQIGLNPQIKLADMPLSFTHALSFYDYNDFSHNTTFNQGANLAGGNPNVDGDATTLDANQFKVLDIYNSVEFKPFTFLPTFKPYFDWAQNLAENAPSASAGGQNQAWALGIKIGNAKTKGQWALGYAYKYIEANSTVGAFNDSDFGHSGRRGSVFSAQYKLTDDLLLNATGFYLNNLNHDLLTRDQAERRFFVDLVWAF